LNTRPWPANQVSVQPPLSQMRMGATLLMIKRGLGMPDFITPEFHKHRHPAAYLLIDHSH
jgi:hypothetical protein